MRWSRFLYFLCLALGDVLFIGLMEIVAIVLRSLISPWYWREDISVFVWLFGVEVLIFEMAALYRELYVKRLPGWLRIKEVVWGVLLSFMFLFSVLALTKAVMISRLFLGIWLMLCLFFVPFLHNKLGEFLVNLGLYRDNLLILGANDVGLRCAEYMLKEKSMGYNLVGFLDDDRVGEEINLLGEKFRVISKVRKVKRITKLLNVGTVMVALEEEADENMIKLVNEIHCISRKILLAPSLHGVAFFNSEIIPPFMDDILLVNLRNNLLYSHNKGLKRSIDIVVGSFLLLVSLPIMLVIGIAIKLDSKGPIFYKQKRLGKGGKEFWMYKFRTMYIDAEKRLKEILQQDKKLKEDYERNWKLRDDPRVTRVGRFLRRFSLDELPQVINVIRGEMSIVGPRPYLPSEKKFLSDMAVLVGMTLPGITGLWQVSGRSDTDYRFRIETDVWYVLNWSLWLDIMILIKTIWVVLKGKGAY